MFKALTPERFNACNISYAIPVKTGYLTLIKAGEIFPFRTIRKPHEKPPP